MNLPKFNQKNLLLSFLDFFISIMKISKILLQLMDLKYFINQFQKI